MRHLLVPTLIAAVAAGAFVASRPGTEADAVAPAQVVGVYKLKLKGDGWLRGKTEPYRMERLSGNASLTLMRNTPDDGRLKVQIQLEPALRGGLIDLATPEPAFAGSGFVVGDSLAVIDTGTPNYVNALTLTFQKEGARVSGHWISTYVAADADTAPASGAGIEFLGRKVGKRDPTPALGAVR